MTTRANTALPRYEPHERPSAFLSLGLGLQSALLSVSPIVLFPIIMVQGVGGGEAEAEVLWAVFAMVVVNGVAVALQSLRFGPIGSGLIVVTYPSSIAIPFCIIALQQGGPATMAALVIVSGLFQIAISMCLSLLRRIVTPTVSGTIIVLLVITIVAVVFGNINDVPDGAPAAAGPVSLAVTLVVLLALLLRGSGPWRMWAPLIGIGAGWTAAAAFGIYDFGPASNAAAAGLPLDGWPGLGLDFGGTFWSLLPAFLFLSVILVFQATSIGLSTQQSPGAAGGRWTTGEYRGERPAPGWAICWLVWPAGCRLPPRPGALPSYNRPAALPATSIS